MYVQAGKRFFCAFMMATMGGWGCDVAPATTVETFTTERCRVNKVVSSSEVPEADFGALSWHAPAVQSVRLTELDGVVHSGSFIANNDDLGVQAAWERQELATWELIKEKKTFRWQGPALKPAIAGAEKLELVVRPGKARTIEVTASHKAEIDRRTRGVRTVGFSLDEVEDPTAPMVLHADLHDLLSGNWDDDRYGAKKLHRIEVSVPKKQAEGFVLENVRIKGEMAAYAEAAAFVKTVERKGRLHPSWVVHDGASVTIDLDVPTDGATLRWMDGAVQFDGGQDAATVKRSVSVEGATKKESVTEPHVEERILDSQGVVWRAQEISLTEWAGQRVSVKMGSHGSGVAFFGDPKMVPIVEADPKVPNVIVVMIDTLRADHLGSWGSPVPDVSPVIDGLVDDGVQFSFALSSSPWTKPAIPTLMTSMAPLTHQVGAHTYTDRLPDGVPTLQQTLSDAGWRTGSFVANPLGTTLSGLENGFDMAMPPRHWKGKYGKLGHASLTQMSKSMLRWQAEQPDQPFFAYIHAMEVHAWRRGPFKNPPEYYEPYDAAVKAADTNLGHLMKGLAKRGLDKNLLLVVLSDHGESFGDHEVKDHGSSLYQSQIHIPLLFWAGMDLPSSLIDEPVGLADVAPTILSMVGTDVPETMQGKSLLPLMTGIASGLHDFVPSARIRYVWKPKDPKWFSMVGQDYQKVVRVGEKEEKTKRLVFDLEADLCETVSTGVAADEGYAAMEAWRTEQGILAQQFTEKWGATGNQSVDAGDVELLRTLGYLE